MASPSFRKEILDHIDRLGPEQQRKLLDFARALANTSNQGIKGKELLRFAGTIKAEDLQMMAQAIEQDWEHVNAND